MNPIISNKKDKFLCFNSVKQKWQIKYHLLLRILKILSMLRLRETAETFSRPSIRLVM